ncbi:MAG: hypothetical protein N2505_06585 [Endomicrobia bacterium]|nr:hypothetical protein [Endomicrobiia bacterium]
MNLTINTNEVSIIHDSKDLLHSLNGKLNQSVFYSLLYDYNNQCESFLTINITFLLDLYGLVKYVMKLKVSKNKKLELVNNIFKIIAYINEEILDTCKNFINSENINYMNKVKEIIDNINQTLFEGNGNKLYLYKEYLNEISKLDENCSMKDIKKVYEEIFNVIKKVVINSKKL